MIDNLQNAWGRFIINEKLTFTFSMVFQENIIEEKQIGPAKKEKGCMY